jgi:transcriptional regulator with GAF, ATPase, and Fis domain/tRNA A-37 threonylcarbamoyl transferase component Bud32/tetratricopeptide (TPR) repeat protein
MAAVSDKLATVADAQTWQRLERAGEGASSVVWKARHAQTQRTVALKVTKPGRDCLEALAREASLLARVGRRWGPELIDAGPGFLVVDWVEGQPLAPVDIAGDRPTLAAEVAHSVARALQELHDAGAFHGDVKPANVLLTGRHPSRDACDDRAATLIDLGLGGDASEAPFGVTPRYAAPELRERREGGQAADLWALGVMLAEILDPALARENDPQAAIAVMGTDGLGGPGEPWRWVQALLAASPGGRPGAGWLAVRASRWLKLTADPQEASCARVERVRRSYLKERAREIVSGASVSPEVVQPAHGWLETAIAWTTKLVAPTGAPGAMLEPLGPVRRARWLTSLVGPSAAGWPIASIPAGDGDFGSRAVELAKIREPASWTLEDFTGRGDPAKAPIELRGDDLVFGLVRDLAKPVPSPYTLTLAEDVAARPGASSTLAVQLAAALARAGETGRAWVALAEARGAEADALRAEVARRRGELAQARTAAERVLAFIDEGSPRWSAQATLARMAWDTGDTGEALRALEGARGPAAAEMHALIDWRQGAFERGLRVVEEALCEPLEADAQARLEGARGMLELARGASEAALEAFGRAVELSTRAGSVIDEATYLTSDAAAASDAGQLARGLASATRAALLWERLGRPERAARAWLARAGALSTLGVTHATDEAAQEAQARAREASDEQTAAYALWARVEVRPPGDAQARTWAIEAAQRLRGFGANDELRADARLLVWAPDAVDAARLTAGDRAAAAAAPPARWEWWGARAHAAVVDGRLDPSARTILTALLSLVDVPAPLGSRGPALYAATRLATESGDGEAARRFDLARAAAARVLVHGTPIELRPSLASVPWAQASTLEVAEVGFAPAQVAQLEAIIRSLSSRERLRPLLEQVLDTMVMWTGVERGLLLLRAPDGRLVARAARNLARRDLIGPQLVLSQTIARRAIETGDAVVATDALSSLGDLHASVHALRLRSVLAVPLMARGETLGVVYLDDRVRKGAFGPRELAWVRVVASQAAMAIADARDAVLLRRSARRAQRANLRLEKILGEREVELDAARIQLELVREGRETRYRYDEIAGRSEPMRDLLRLVDRVTASDVPVLVIGESGTGKELVARAVHQNGPRSRRTFVSENCASVPDTLLESALFGHVRGAFTGASATRAGLFDIADGGTLFLDEIGEMSLAMQSKLLRVLQDGEVRPVGGERVRQVDVRVIGATNRDLVAMVAAGSFREDLFYRLNVVTLRVPPLRERSEDVPLLVQHFVNKHAPDRTVKVTRAAMAKLVSFAWPGNVRQLENELRRALVLSDDVIDVAELSDDVRRGGKVAARRDGLNMRSRVDGLETELLLEALTKTRGNQTRAAQLLGLSRFGLQKMMKRLGVNVDPRAWYAPKRDA